MTKSPGISSPVFVKIFSVCEIYHTTLSYYLIGESIPFVIPVSIRTPFLIFTSNQPLCNFLLLIPVLVSHK